MRVPLDRAGEGVRMLVAKLQKLAMDPRRIPPCVLPRHPSDQIADLPRHGWSARLSPPRFPCPEKSEPLAVPIDDGLELDDYQGVAPTRPKVESKRR